MCCSILLCVNFYYATFNGYDDAMGYTHQRRNSSVPSNLNRFFSWGSMWGVSEAWTQRTRPSWDGNDIFYTLYSPHINLEGPPWHFWKGFYLNLARCQVDCKFFFFFSLMTGHSDLWRGSIHQAPLHWYSIAMYWTKGDDFYWLALTYEWPKHYEENILVSLKWYSDINTMT